MKPRGLNSRGRMGVRPPSLPLQTAGNGNFFEEAAFSGLHRFFS
jgi:hypothetical protein